MKPLKQAIKDLISFVKVNTFRSLSFNGGQVYDSIPILMYHKVNPVRDVLGLSISPSFFDYQLAFLKSRYCVITLEMAISLLETGGVWEEKYAVITFDDGYRDNYDYAFPLLMKHNIPATMFVTVDALQTGKFGWSDLDRAILDSPSLVVRLTSFGLKDVDISTRIKKIKTIVYLHKELKLCAHDKRERVINHVVQELSEVRKRDRVMLNWDEAKDMQRSGLVSIGSHTITHPILTRVSSDRVRDEITLSKVVIEEKLGVNVDLFAYPNGSAEDFDDETISILKNAGYSAACTTLNGSAVRETDLFRLPRVDVTFGMCEGIGGRFSPEMFDVALSK